MGSFFCFCVLLTELASSIGAFISAFANASSIPSHALLSWKQQMFNEVCSFCSGALPDISGMFSQTREFNVSNNLLTGTIPAAFSSVGAVNKSLVGSQLSYVSQHLHTLR